MVYIWNGQPIIIDTPYGPVEFRIDDIQFAEEVDQVNPTTQYFRAKELRHITATITAKSMGASKSTPAIAPPP